MNSTANFSRWKLRLLPYLSLASGSFLSFYCFMITNKDLLLTGLIFFFSVIVFFFLKSYEHKLSESEKIRGFFQSKHYVEGVTFAVEDSDGSLIFADKLFREDFLQSEELPLIAKSFGGHQVLEVLFSDLDDYTAFEKAKSDIEQQIKDKGSCQYILPFGYSDENGDRPSVLNGAMHQDGKFYWSIVPLTKEAEENKSARERLLFLHKVMDQAPFGVITCDVHFVAKEANRAARKFFQGNLSFTHSNFERFHPDDQLQLKNYLRKSIDSGDTFSESLDIRISGKSEMTVSLRVLKTNDDTNGLLLVHLVDVSERKKLEGQFAQSQKMQAVGQLAGGVAHDFNNMLTAIIGFCDLLLLRHQPGDPSFVDTMQIKQNANRAAGLVRQLLAFSRSEELEPQILNVADVFAELSSLLQRLIGDNIELDILHGRELGRVKFDQVQLDQVIINLAVNGRDAMKSGGKLTIQTDNFTAKRSYPVRGEVMPPGEYVSISVTDTGQGIAKKNLDHIFEPFFTTKEVGEGTGLGLSMVFGSVKQSGGFTFVHSAGKNKGTTFIIYLPKMEAVDASEIERQDNQEIAKDDTGAGSILLVEDEDGVRLFAARALRSKGYHVVEARSGVVALDIMKEEGNVFDLLITDMMMPKVSGADVIHYAHDAKPNMPVICISGYTQETVAKEISSLSHIYFLSKPFSLKQLTSRVREALDSADNRQDDYKNLPLGS